MRFEEVLLKMLQDNSLRARKKGCERYYKIHKFGNDHLLIIDEEEKNYSYITSVIPKIEDILSDDWYLLNKNKLVNFEEAWKCFKQGKKIKLMGFEVNMDTSWMPEHILCNEWEVCE